MRKEKKFNIETDLLDKLYVIQDIEDINDFINKSLNITFRILEILRKSKQFASRDINYFVNNSIVLSDKTIYELKKVKELFKNLDIAGNKEDELIGYALRLIQSIHNTKLPKGE